jgi:hypothetical protein
MDLNIWLYKYIFYLFIIWVVLFEDQNINNVFTKIKRLTMYVTSYIFVFMPLWHHIIFLAILALFGKK